MSADSRRIRVGSRIRFGDTEYDVSGVDGTVVYLTTPGCAPLTVRAADLLTDRTFRVLSSERSRRIAPPPIFEQLPVEVRERALRLEHHITEILDGVPFDAPTGTLPRPEYCVLTTTLRQREVSKAAEMAASGEPIPLRSLQRMRQSYEAENVFGLVDKRLIRRSSALGRADERVVASVRRVLAANTEASSGSADRLRRAVERDLAEQYPGESVSMPSRPTFYRLLDRMAEARHATGSARTRRTLAKQPTGPFGSVVAVRPGELTQIDSTPLDVAIVLDDGVIGRVELTALVDVATRSIAAAVLRPTTKAVDAALLLAKAMTPEPMRPGWPEAIAMANSALPFQHMLAVDDRLRDAAARPVIVPETIVFDHGKVFVSNTFRSACRTLGVTIQPAHPDTPTDKGIVERTLGSVATLFAEKVTGYLGSSVERRGNNAEGQAAFSLVELQSLLDEWIVTCWQNRPHDGLRDPLSSKQMLTPNEKYAALLAVAGYVPAPLSGEDYIRLLPSVPRVINAYGVKIDHRVYDDEALNPLRGEKSGIAALGGRWAVHYDPYDVTRVWIRNRADDAWITAYWKQLRAVPQPFGQDAWNHARRVVAERGQQAPTEETITAAVDDLLDRAAAPSNAGRAASSRKGRRVAARTRATNSVASPIPPTEPVAGPALAEQDADDDIADVIPLPVFDPDKEAKSWW
ncbi:Mu transposase C-terminal domain-containing protein [Antrihabitans cavernicola]|uniref:DDE-type integrase/transposase/recombinase n=1 Tax=Antrihabitans cavernicola TaxID=2495913 RepID=A0A5A7SA11_9NOCA|nr:Mu transposase C-terminal domain-containing protein [Spelaeibacter cavernicola]KAA0021375.1 DDE-type integrase/transposase/recombinase [Spelaeibacter cavernicola]